MASTSKKASLSKDQLIIAQSQMIEQLKATILRLSTGTQPVLTGQEFVATTSDGAEVALAAGMEMPTLSLEELSAYSDIQPIQFVTAGQVTLISEVLQPAQKGRRGGRIGQRGRVQPRRRNRTADVESMDMTGASAAEGDVDLVNGMVEQDQGEGGRPSANRDAMTHILVLGTPHTRKIPLRCTVEDCVHGDYRAWDRDLLLKHYKRYHPDTHPNPAFNYLCPVEGCKYISYNEPSYALYTHIKNIHQEYLKKLEQDLADGTPTVERDLNEVQIEKLPSQIQRTPVPILGVLNMEKTGMRCPLPVCAGGSQVYKSSSMKRLTDHFAKVHSFTHPSPIFIFCCPVENCEYTSDVGNFRVYYHLKAQHPDYCTQMTGIRYGPASPSHVILTTEDAHSTELIGNTAPELSDGQIPDAAEASITAANEPEETQPTESGDTESVTDEQESGVPVTKILMCGSRNMVLDPLKCPIDDCPKEGFFATSTATLRRHFRRHHRQTHPNPEFFFQCPVEGCEFISSNKGTMNIWRHTTRCHPEIWLSTPQPLPVLSTEDAAAATEIEGVTEPTGLPSGEAQRAEQRPIEELLIVEAVQDVLNPHMLVKPTQMRCLHPGCTKPPFAGSDKVQLMRHYAHFHPTVDRLQPILVLCPYKDCTYQCGWPAKPLFYHVEAVHGVPAEDTQLPSKSAKGRSKAPAALVDGRSPVRIVGRPTAAGEFWCPVPGCGYTNGVLLNLRLHVVEKHSATHPNPAFIFVCPLQSCSFAKQNNYQALCTHMQREHGMKREKKPARADASLLDTSRTTSTSAKRKRDDEEPVGDVSMEPETTEGAPEEGMAEEQAAVTPPPAPVSEPAPDDAVAVPPREKRKKAAGRNPSVSSATKRKGSVEKATTSKGRVGELSPRRGRPRKAKTAKKQKSQSR